MADRCQCRQHGGVGDEPVKPSPPTGNCRGKPWDGRRIPHVQFHDGGRTSGSLDLVIDLFKRADGTTGDNDLRPGCGCGGGNGAADAARRLPVSSLPERSASCCAISWRSRVKPAWRSVRLPAVSDSLR